MQHDQFVGKVQNRAELSSRGEAIRATRVVLTVLGERLQPGEASDLAGPLPMEIDRYLEAADSGQRFDYDEFVERVADREGVEVPDANHHAQVVVQTVSETVYASELREVKDGLPDDYDELFELADEQASPE